MRPLVAVAAVGAVVAALAACDGAEPSEVPTVAESAEGTTSPTAATPPLDARLVLRKAVRQWRTADTGAFTQTVAFGPTGEQVTEGVYGLSSRRSSVTSVADVPGQPRLELRVIGIGDTSYLTMAGWPAGIRGCWMAFDGSTLETVTGLEQTPGAGGLPANVVALSHAQGQRVDPGDPESLTGTVDLSSAAAMFGSGVLRLLGDGTTAGTVLAEFTVVDGAIESWRIAGAALVTALDREGLLDEDDQVRNVLGGFEVVVEYRDLGTTRLDVRPPPRSLVMSPAEVRARRCEGAR